MPLLRHKLGGHVTAGEESAKRLVASGFFEIVDEFVREDREVVVDPAQSHADATKTSVQDDDTQEADEEPTEPSEVQESVSQRPDVATVRAWAKENDVPVSDKGRVAESVYVQYAEAHKN